MIQFAIIIPFRPKAESVDWEQECSLLQQTIFSLLQQTYRGIHIYVIYTDVPLLQVADERVSYEATPFVHERYDDMQNNAALLQLFKSAKLVVRRWDKARKLCYGSMLAKHAKADYIMAMDADDRLSKYFFERLSTSADGGNCPGWYMHSGYLYKDGSNYLVRVPKLMRLFNGSTHVLHNRLVRIPDFSSLDWQDYNLFTDHGWIKDRVKKEYNADLKIVDYPALVYVVHGSNISQVNGEFGFSFRKLVKRLLRSVRLSSSLREEFFLRSLVFITGGIGHFSSIVTIVS
nr:hypothetical protein [uncultured Lacibacter sp.]